ncbi:MAG TPA: sodium:proline symporter, partial [Spirochaetota bacterium]|nr:sodium:proline symporter [Spirochaetota bacterium]
LVLVMISSLLVYVIQSISGAWLFIIECGAGLGLVLIVRWYWWRINAWSEIVAMVVPFGAYIASRFYLKLQFPESLFFIVAVTTAAWVTATCITPPVEHEVLRKFYDRVRPGGPGWKNFRKPEEPAGESLIALGIDWLLGIVMIYCALFSIGKIIFQSYLPGFLLLGSALTLFVIINLRLKRRG